MDVVANGIVIMWRPGDNPSVSRKRLSAGVKAGISIAVILLTIAAFLGIFFYLRRHKQRQKRIQATAREDNGLGDDDRKEIASPTHHQGTGNELPTSTNMHKMPPETAETPLPPEARIQEMYSEPQFTHTEEAHGIPPQMPQELRTQGLLKLSGTKLD
jgi:hypothetical protein